MPYVKIDNRKQFEQDLKHICNFNLTDGDMNYIFTYIINNQLNKRGLNYQNINNLIGLLECCKLELYRRIAEPYEDKKIIENGDVYNA